MGDRVSIQFKSDQDWPSGDGLSMVLFHHWGGEGFVDLAKLFVHKLNEEVPQTQGDPVTRRECSSMMVQFIAWLQKNGHCDNYRYPGLLSHSLYLGKDQNDGDNTDNGHFVICARTGKTLERHEYNWETKEQVATFFAS
jgi:hypothetical protein